jgi:hypothetical protein
VELEVRSGPPSIEIDGATLQTDLKNYKKLVKALNEAVA